MSALVDALVDDAGLFPPTALAMPQAVARYRGDLAASGSMLTHRFLCPASRIEELREELTAADRIRVGLIADTGLDGLAAVLAVVADDPRLTLAVIEFPLAKTSEAVAEVIAQLPAGVPIFVEPAAYADIPDLLATLVEHGAGLKLRCGGVRAELFPTVGELAEALVAAARAGVAVKATAGLHHAVRYTDAATGFTHHGYLNLLLASAAAAQGEPVADVAAVLALADGAALISRAALDPAAIAATRRLFTSYGSCSTHTPAAEAAALGLLEEGISQ
ncbi:hypothetical protein D5S18_02300 [Nocardia panacis]|uniref:Aldolase n=1 Tax=Nocardia panacis TaxID=2340916 RepID=A0A3A4KSD8_9NOCA|nr:hypothetical protein [Nocardia panacis]RJO79196.1 hypothetical protein D5S18_02300 [Nocardia panacis]